MKREIKTVNGTPNKRMYWSIISDYSLNTAICELVDNALDIWLKGGQKTHLKIVINVDVVGQIITILDCAGGIAAEDHQLLISPGASNNDPEDQIIGLFGVGSKRAVVALARDVKIFSRHKDNQSYEIDIYEEWLKSDSWDLPVYEIDGIEENTTQIELTKLRIHPSAEDVTTLKAHLSETYTFFLKKSNFELVVNDEPLAPVEFESWAYPPGFEPRCYLFEVFTEDGGKVGVEINAGLTREKEPGREDYGVYFYCNERLIAKEIKEKEVGYISAHAGIPHSDASLARVIVKLYGPARLMPWNSSKSAINFGHHIFKGLRDFLIPVVSDYSSLSRRFKGKWEEEVFKYDSGEMQYVDIQDIAKVKRSYLPPLPRVRKHLIDHLRAQNKQVLQEKPWTLGLLEAIAAVEIIRRQRLQTKNRIALLLLDSSFEIALKEYIVHTDNLNLGKRKLEQIFENRDEVIKIAKQKITFDPKELAKIKHFNQLRNKLVHERATVDITDDDVSNYVATVQSTLGLLFGLNFPE
jgi:hypothetical protein